MHTVTKAMEAVSAVKMRKSQERALGTRPYAISALSILKRVSDSKDAVSNPLTIRRSVQKVCVLVVTSDKGLAGSLNGAVLKSVIRTMEEQNVHKEDVSFICIGNKGYDFLTKRGYSVLKKYENISDNVSIKDMKEVTTHITDLFIQEKVDQCFIAYTNFISTFEQQVVIRELLPISFDEIEKVISEIVPEKGKYRDIKTEDKNPVLYSVEPDSTEVLEELLPFLLNIQIYHSLLEAKASEHSARMVAMKNASDKARDMSKELNLEFNKARQGLITREVSEIIGGMETLTA